MLPLPLLLDLYRHLEWAESLVWSAALAHPRAVADEELRDRLQHIHSTQRVFLEVWTGKPVGRYWGLTFPSLRELYAWTHPWYAEMSSYLPTVNTEQLDTPTPVPWRKMFVRQLGREAAGTTLGETLFQVTSHSTYHRGQVNTRLRVLGVEPPLVDYIAWLWSDRPAPSWPGSA